MPLLLTAEQKCMLWLSAAEVTPGKVQELLNRFGSLQEVWERFDKDEELRFHPAAKGVLSSMHSRDAVDELHGTLERKNVKLLFREDKAYPPLLGEIQDPPYLLYYAGKLDCLKRPMIAVVGTRRASAYGQEMASMISRGLCDAGMCVVSGLARGIDAAAHKAAVESGGHTIGVLGSGINVPYPPEHTELLRKIAGGIGLVLSEYPLNAEPRPYHFPHRNRIISGLSMGTVFVEGRIQSGGMHTVHAALIQGREVFAVPGKVGSYGSEGPHAILREGARIITSAQDVLEDLGLASEASANKRKPDADQNLTPLQHRIVDLLHVEALNIQELTERLKISENELFSEIGMLEILGVIEREAGNRFHLPLTAGQ